MERLKANKNLICGRINDNHKEKLNSIKIYLNKHRKELPKSIYYKCQGSPMTDGDIIRFLIEKFIIPEPLKTKK